MENGKINGFLYSNKQKRRKIKIKQNKKKSGGNAIGFGAVNT